MCRRVVAVTLAAFAIVSLLASRDRGSGQETSTIAASWLARARVAGAELFAEMTADEIAESLSALPDQNVSVIEADSSLSRLLTDQEFNAELALMRRDCEAAHRLGMKGGWYYPTLEVLSSNVQEALNPNITLRQRLMAEMQPTWLQRGLNGKPNVFVGSKDLDRRVHWVDTDTESAWMSLHSPYVDMFIDRIKKIAATGVDGIWLDVPIYND